MDSNGCGMAVNSCLGNTVNFRTQLRPKTGSPKIQRDTLVRSLGMKRVNEFRKAAKSRVDSCFPRSWFSEEEGHIEFADQFVLGQNGGKWADPQHIMCAKPGREATPPAYSTRNARRSARGFPGMMDVDQLQIGTRRLVEKLSRPEQRSLLSALGADTSEDPSIVGQERSALFRQAGKACGRLPFSDLQKLCGEFGFEMRTQWAQIKSGGGTVGCSGICHVNAHIPTTCLGKNSDSPEDLALDNVQKPPPTAGEVVYYWNPITKTCMPMGGACVPLSQRPQSQRPQSVAARSLPTDRAWHSLHRKEPEPRAPLVRLHKKSGAINNSSKDREWNKWDFSGTVNGGVCTRGNDVRAKTSIPRGRLDRAMLNWGL